MVLKKRLVMKPFQNKTVLITGGTSGIGKATRQRTGRTQSLKGIFEGRLSTECLDGNVHATTGGEAPDFFNGIYLSEINRVIRTEQFCRLQTIRYAVNDDDFRRT